LHEHDYDLGSEIDAANQRLDEELDAAGADLLFVSDSSLPHPSSGSLVGTYLRHLKKELEQRWRSYYLMEKDPSLTDRILRFHEQVGERLGDQQVIPGTGSAAMLSTVLTWAADAERPDRILICSPPYVKVVHLLHQLRVSAEFVYDPRSIEPLEWNLPEQKSVLVLTDPVWFAGCRLPMGAIEEIREWQQRTGSLVFVDGTFQYMQWHEPLHERSALLDPERTIRLVCPTKSLAAHGFRFAYLLAPARHARELRDLYRLMHGAASVADGVFANAAMKALLSPLGNRGMVADAKARAQQLGRSDRCEQAIPSDSGYFRLVHPIEGFCGPSTIGMDQACFGLRGYPGFIRVNVLNDEALARFGVTSRAEDVAVSA
jgi:aspartate/methionine/tyrosine aminotransferase